MENLKLAKLPVLQRTKILISLNGKVVSDFKREELIQRVTQFKSKTGRAPHLSVILIGEDRASQVYVRNKHLACQKIGMSSEVLMKPTSTSAAELKNLLQQMNINPNVDGVLVQLPLPKHLSQEIVLEHLDPAKDADGMTYMSTGYVWSGRPHVRPCTPSGVIDILKYYKIPMKGKRTVIVGRSQIVGKPMAALLLEENATVTICHSQTENLREYLHQAEIVVVAAGKPRFLGREDFAKDSVVIDVGIHGSGSGKVCGDVRFEELNGWVKAATPVPGGVGPMTITSLLANTMILAEKRGFRS